MSIYGVKHSKDLTKCVLCFSNCPWVPCGLVVKCLTRNPGVLGLSRAGSSWFFHGSVLGQDTSEPGLVLVKPRKDMNNVSCHRDMTEILMKQRKTPFNQSIDDCPCQLCVCSSLFNLWLKWSQSNYGPFVELPS